MTPDETSLSTETLASITADVITTSKSYNLTISLYIYILSSSEYSHKPY